jgi:hypothetical protein
MILSTPLALPSRISDRLSLFLSLSFPSYKPRIATPSIPPSLLHPISAFLLHPSILHPSAQPIPHPTNTKTQSSYPITPTTTTTTTTTTAPDAPTLSIQNPTQLSSAHRTTPKSLTDYLGKKGPVVVSIA